MNQFLRLGKIGILSFTCAAFLLQPARLQATQARPVSKVSHPPVTQPPITHSPVTHSPVTHPPVTHSPVTRSPVTHSPVTHSPVTHSPVTHSPLTHPPVSRPPVTRPLVPASSYAGPRPQSYTGPRITPVASYARPTALPHGAGRWATAPAAAPFTPVANYSQSQPQLYGDAGPAAAAPETVTPEAAAPRSDTPPDKLTQAQEAISARRRDWPWPTFRPDNLYLAQEAIRAAEARRQTLTPVANYSQSKPQLYADAGPAAAAPETVAPEATAPRSDTPPVNLYLVQEAIRAAEARRETLRLTTTILPSRGLLRSPYTMTPYEAAANGRDNWQNAVAAYNADPVNNVDPIGAYNAYLQALSIWYNSLK